MQMVRRAANPVGNHHPSPFIIICHTLRSNWNQRMVCPPARSGAQAESSPSASSPKSPGTNAMVRGAGRNGAKAHGGGGGGGDGAAVAPHVPDTPKCGVGFMKIPGATSSGSSSSSFEVINAFGATTFDTSNQRLVVPINSRAYVGSRCAAGTHDPTEYVALTSLLGESTFNKYIMHEKMSRYLYLHTNSIAGTLPTELPLRRALC